MKSSSLLRLSARRSAWARPWAGALSLLLVSAAAAQGSDFPTKPIQLLVGYGAGGSTDVCMRALATHASTLLGQQFVVVNRPGAGSSLSIAYLKSQPADGYTIAALATGAVLNQFLNRRIGYDVTTDLEPIALVAQYQAAMVVRADSPWKTAADIVNAAKSGAVSVSYSTAGTGTPQHLIMSRLGQTSQIPEARWTHVAYKSGPEAITALMRGDVNVLSQTAEWAPHVRDGRLRLVSVYTDTRMDGFESTPTLRESGYDLVAPSLLGVVAPKGVPADIVRKLESALREASETPAYKTCAQQFALKTDFRPAAAFKDYIADTVKTWGPIASTFVTE